MGLFSDAEMRLLRLGDRGIDDKPRKGYAPRGRSGYVGKLTDNDVLLMHADGKTTAEIAEVAGVTARSVTRWKRLRGLNSNYKPTGITARTPAEYKRQYYQLRIKRSAP